MVELIAKGKALSLRGAVLEGEIVSVHGKTAVVQMNYIHKVRKYERLEKRRRKIHAHVPDGLALKQGDVVKIAECRKISKTKSHVVLPKDYAKV